MRMQGRCPCCLVVPLFASRTTSWHQGSLEALPDGCLASNLWISFSVSILPVNLLLLCSSTKSNHGWETQLYVCPSISRSFLIVFCLVSRAPLQSQAPVGRTQQGNSRLTKPVEFTDQINRIASHLQNCPRIHSRVAIPQRSLRCPKSPDGSTLR